MLQLYRVFPGTLKIQISLPKWLNQGLDISYSGSKPFPILVSEDHIGGITEFFSTDRMDASEKVKIAEWITGIMPESYLDPIRLCRIGDLKREGSDRIGDPTDLSGSYVFLNIGILSTGHQKEE